MTLEISRPRTAELPLPVELTGALTRSPTGIEQAIAEASHRADAGDMAAAEQAYRFADALLGSERSPRHAEVLVCLALILRRRGEASEAARHLDMALAIFPGHRAALSQRLDLAHEQGDLAAAAGLRVRMLDFCESAEARVHVLLEVVADALEAAAASLRQAIQLQPLDTDLRERLRALSEAAFDHESAVNASVDLAESLRDPKAKARALAHAARLCAQKIGNADRAVALYEAAIADDPTVAGAFEAIESILIDVGDLQGTEQAYARQVERLRAGGYAIEEAALLHKLAILREDQLADSPGAIAALERAILLRPDDPSSHRVLALLLARREKFGQAMAHLERAARLSPASPMPFREIVHVAFAAKDRDRGFFAASALVHMGEADVHEQELYRRFATYGAPGVSQPMDEVTLSMLRPRVNPVRALLLALHDPAIRAKQLQQRASKAPPPVDERERVDPEQSTVSAVRVVAWTMKLLGLPVFRLHVRPGQGFALSHPTTSEPTLVLGGGMLSGRSVPELLFRAGYELGAQRELGRLLVFYPEREQLQTLVAAAAGLVEPAKLPSSAVDLSRALDQCLDDSTRAHLQALVAAALGQRHELDVSSVLRDVETVAGRIGLLACTDLTVAARQVAIEARPTEGLSASDRVRDLLAFAVSQTHADVRSLLGMSVSEHQAQRF